MTLLEISNLSIVFPGRQVLDNLNLEIGAGEIVGLLGQSGAGKTMAALAILGLLPSPARIPGGEIRYQGRNLLGISTRKLREIRGCEIGMIFQDPRSALNPVMRIDRQLCEGMIWRLAYSKQKALDESFRLLEAVGIQDPSRCLKAYPHQLSGGMRQRVIIASALSCRPRLLICDEITSSVDSLVQSRILSLLKQLQCRMNLSILLITHDLQVVGKIADRTAVMLNGRVVEEGRTEKILKEPTHAFTRSLSATPAKNENT